MAFKAGIPDQFKQDILNGVHQPSDTYKIALFVQLKATDKNSSSVTYNSTGEIDATPGNGYEQGGRTLTGFTVGATDLGGAYMDFADPVWPEITVTADAAVIYNASKLNKILLILGFPRTVSTNGPFTVKLPPKGAIVLA
jgi:hypothetical protein